MFHHGGRKNSVKLRGMSVVIHDGRISANLCSVAGSSQVANTLVTGRILSAKGQLWLTPLHGHHTAIQVWQLWLRLTPKIRADVFRVKIIIFLRLWRQNVWANHINSSSKSDDGFLSIRTIFDDGTVDCITRTAADQKNVRVIRNFELDDVFLNGETKGKSGIVVRVMR